MEAPRDFKRPLPPKPELPAVNGRSNAATNGKAARKTSDRFGPKNHFVDFTMRNIKSKTTIAVFNVFDRRYNDGHVTISQSEIAELAGCSVRQVRRAVAELERLGYVRVSVRGKSFSTCSTYQIVTPNCGHP